MAKKTSREIGETRLKEMYIGKKVRIQANVLFNPKAIIVGECTFIGFNEYMGKRQITVGRMPIFTESYEDLKIQIMQE